MIKKNLFLKGRRKSCTAKGRRLSRFSTPSGVHVMADTAMTGPALRRLIASLQVVLANSRLALDRNVDQAQTSD